ncbi:MAG TPA: TetR/AcrR family transcriptional regulator [Aliidongia sp.]|nr:TetR/AcrR family transcriptional regulator [Aliidongia sp.]
MGTAGRPRSEESHKAILQAAYDLLHEGGFARFTFERVAARAGVSRSTIYRWWPSKGALAMESAFDALSVELAFEPSRSPVDNFRTRLRLVAVALKGRPGRIIAGMLAEGQQDPGTIEIFTKLYIEPARRITRALLHQAVDEGFLRPDFDIEMAIDIAFGALYHQLLLGRTLERDWIDRLVDFIFRGALIEPSPIPN